MVLLDINQEKNVLDELVITKYEIFIPLLKIISSNEGISQNSLRKESKVSGGKIYHSVKALKSMKLVENGIGLRITELGRKFLHSYSEDRKVFKEVLKTACLNVPLFKKIYEQNPEEKNPQKLYKLFDEKLNERYRGLDEKLIGSAVRRYLMGIHGIKLRAGARLYKTEKKTPQQKFKTKIQKNDDDIINSFKFLKKNLNLSNEELNQMINSLPQEKKDELVSQIFSKVFN